MTSSDLVSRPHFNVLYSIILSWFLVGVRANWEVSVERNPGCLASCEQFNLVYIRARNDSSSVHTFVDAFANVPPSILIVHSHDQTAEPLLDWTLLANRSSPSEAIRVSGVTQSYGLVFVTLVDYNDTQDVVDMSLISPDQRSNKHMKLWQWTLRTVLDPGKSISIGDNIFEVLFVANSTDHMFSNSGSVQLKILVTNADRANPMLPSLSFVPGLSVQFELALDHLVSSYDRGRFGLQLMFVSNETVFPEEDYMHTSIISIDDEITPGIFKTVNVNLGQAVHQDTGAPRSSYQPQPAAFLQTRPICYTVNATERAIKYSRDVIVSTHGDFPTAQQRRAAKGSLPYMFFGDRYFPQFQGVSSAHEWIQRFPGKEKPDLVGMRVQNVSFGTSEDRFYKASDYVVWTASFGFGEPPQHRMSSLLIGLISLSVCVILASLVFGSLTLIILHRRRRPAGNTHNFSLLSESQDTFTSVPT